MKKYLIALITALVIISSQSVCLFAGSLSLAEKQLKTVEGFEVTGGIDNTKDMEITFDKTRVISGTAQKGTKITVEVFEVSGKGDKKDYYIMDSYELTVGSSGIFSQAVKLSIGENLVKITADYNDVLSTQEASIKCKRSELKKELQNNIALPGQAFAQLK